MAMLLPPGTSQVERQEERNKRNFKRCHFEFKQRYSLENTITKPDEESPDANKVSLDREEGVKTLGVS